MTLTCDGAAAVTICRETNGRFAFRYMAPWEKSGLEPGRPGFALVYPGDRGKCRIEVFSAGGRREYLAPPGEGSILTSFGPIANGLTERVSIETGFGTFPAWSFPVPGVVAGTTGVGSRVSAAGEQWIVEAACSADVRDIGFAQVREILRGWGPVP